MKNFYCIILALSSLILFSCQDEFENETQSPANTITKSSPLTSLVLRVAQNRTTFDNIIDGTSCFSVQLPVNVTVNSHFFVIQSESDYTDVKAIIDESQYDDDVFHFTYPITLIYRNFQSVIINSKHDLDSIIETCGDDTDFHEIDCIGFNYPIVINTYDKNNQVAATVTIQSDSQFFNFVDDLKETDIVSFVYPVAMTNTTGQLHTYNNNLELMEGIESVIGTCDDDGGEGSELSDILVKGTWYVSSFLEETEDETNEFYGYIFTFSSNGDVVANKNSATINGTWSIGGDKKLNINFDGTLLEELEDNWSVLESTSTTIQLKHESGGGGETHYLTFSKN